MLAKVRTDPDTYLKDPASTMTEDADKKVLETFNAGFNIEEYTDEIARLLDDYPETRNMMNELGNTFFFPHILRDIRSRLLLT